MQFQFSFKNMEKSESLQQYVEAKVLDRIHKYVTKPNSAHITFEQDRHNVLVKCNISGGDGFNIQVEHTAKEANNTVDHMIEKLETQLRRHKEKLKTHKTKDPMKRHDLTAVKGEGADAIDAEDILKYEKARKKLSVV